MFGFDFSLEKVYSKETMSYFESLDRRIPLPNNNLSIADHKKDCDLKQLNNHQERAVKRSLRGRFTLIQGPPGELK